MSRLKVLAAMCSAVFLVACGGGSVDTCSVALSGPQMSTLPCTVVISSDGGNTAFILAGSAVNGAIVLPHPIVAQDYDTTNSGFTQFVATTDAGVWTQSLRHADLANHPDKGSFRLHFSSVGDSVHHARGTLTVDMPADTGSSGTVTATVTFSGSTGTWLETLLQDTLALSGLVFIAMLVAATRVMIRVRRSSGQLAISAFLDDLTARCLAWKPGEEENESEPLWSAVSREIVFREPGGKLIARSDPRKVAEAEAVELLGRGGSGTFIRLVGDNLTAIALVLTFALLGFVLVGPVAEALRETGDQQSLLLRSAVGKMGAKFFISAFGLLGAVFIQRWLTAASDALVAHLRAGARPLAALIEDLGSYQARATAQTAQSVLALRSDLQVVGGEWTSQLRRLESINVTISGIGEEVATRFSTVMTKDVADRICSAVVELQNHAATVAETMQSKIATSFAAALQTEMGRVQDGLEAVTSAIQGQGQSDIEAILAKMSNMLTGGYKSESASMAQQLSQFAAVLPQLQTEFAGLAGTMRENAAQYGEQNQRTIEALGARMNDLATHFEAARAGMSGAVGQMAEAGSAAARQLSEATSTQLGGLLQQFDATRTRMDSMMDKLSRVSSEVALSVSQSVHGHSEAVAGQVKSMQKAGAEGVANLQQQSAAFAETMNSAQSRLVESTSQLSRTVANMDQALGTLATIQKTNVQALTVYSQSAQDVSTTVKRFSEAVVGQQAVIDNEKALLESHRKAAEALGTVLAQFLKTYEEGIKRQSQLLTAEWETLATKTATLVGGASEDLSQSVDEFSQALRESTKSNRGVRP